MHDHCIEKERIFSGGRVKYIIRRTNKGDRSEITIEIMIIDLKDAF